MTEAIYAAVSVKFMENLKHNGILPHPCETTQSLIVLVHNDDESPLLSSLEINLQYIFFVFTYLLLCC